MFYCVFLDLILTRNQGLGQDLVQVHHLDQEKEIVIRKVLVDVASIIDLRDLIHDHHFAHIDTTDAAESVYVDGHILVPIHLVLSRRLPVHIPGPTRDLHHDPSRTLGQARHLEVLAVKSILLYPLTGNDCFVIVLRLFHSKQDSQFPMNLCGKGCLSSAYLLFCFGLVLG